MLFLFVLGSSLFSESVQGFVYLDQNKNGSKDEGEKGIAGVLVSNQKEVVVTDSEGKYSLTIEKNTIVFITKPAQYALPVSAENLPFFYYIHKQEGSPKLSYAGMPPTGPLPKEVNFPLLPAEESEDFEVVVATDPQPETTQEVDFIRQDFVEEVIGTKAKFVLVLGDTVFNHLDLWKYYKPLMAQIGVPIHNVLGNHDMNLDAPSDEYSDETFEKNFGPTYYSFDYGRVHFVVLDSINLLSETTDPNAKEYEARLGEKQLLWLKNDIALVPADKLVILAMHAPFFTTASRNTSAQIMDRNEAFKILKYRKHILALAGHIHHLEHHFLDEGEGWKGDKPLHQVVCAAVCGAWWSGPQDERGVPLATQGDGVPNGYHILEIRGNEYKLRYKSCHQAADYQMLIHSPSGVLSQKEAQNARILVNVFDSGLHTEVSFQIDAGEWQPLTNVYEKDPGAVSLFEKGSANQKHWVRAVKTRHLWAASLPQLNVGAHKITIQAKDFQGRIHRASRVFYLW